MVHLCVAITGHCPKQVFSDTPEVVRRGTTPRALRAGTGGHRRVPVPLSGLGIGHTGDAGEEAKRLARARWIHQTRYTEASFARIAKALFVLGWQPGLRSWSANRVGPEPCRP